MNHQIFERMLCFRVLLGACLFECLFSPLAFSPLVKSADCGLSRGAAPSGACASSTQVERRREPLSAASLFRKRWRGGSMTSSQRLNQRGATQVKTVLGCGCSDALNENRLDKGFRIVRPSCFRRRTNQKPFGPQIKQEDPLNLSI